MNTKEAELKAVEFLAKHHNLSKKTIKEQLKAQYSNKQYNQFIEEWRTGVRHGRSN